MKINANLSDKLLSQKLLIVLLLLGGKIINTVHSFQVDKPLITSTSATFSPRHVLKHARLRRKINTFTYRAYHYLRCCMLIFVFTLKGRDQF